jgi:hypothetical protein
MKVNGRRNVQSSPPDAAGGQQDDAIDTGAPGGLEQFPDAVVPAQEENAVASRELAGEAARIVQVTDHRVAVVRRPRGVPHQSPDLVTGIEGLGDHFGADMPGRSADKEPHRGPGAGSHAYEPTARPYEDQGGRTEKEALRGAPEVQLVSHRQKCLDLSRINAAHRSLAPLIRAGGA